jgi:hypothetical protein
MFRGHIVLSHKPSAVAKVETPLSSTKSTIPFPMSGKVQTYSVLGQHLGPKYENVLSAAFPLDLRCNIFRGFVKLFANCVSELGWKRHLWILSPQPLAQHIKRQMSRDENFK